jgi:uncharacterized membrane protein
MNPPLGPGAVNNGALDDFNRDGGQVDAEHAGGFARSGADAASELGKVIGGVETMNGGLPASIVCHIIPVGNEVVDRTAGVAEGNAAVHAARALLALLLFG